MLWFSTHNLSYASDSIALQHNNGLTYCLNSHWVGETFILVKLGEFSIDNTRAKEKQCMKFPVPLLTSLHAHYVIRFVYVINTFSSGLIYRRVAYERKNGVYRLQRSSKVTVGTKEIDRMLHKNS